MKFSCLEKLDAQAKQPLGRRDDDGHDVDIIDAVGILPRDIRAMRDASHEASEHRVSRQVEVVGEVLQDTGIRPSYRRPDALRLVASLDRHADKNPSTALATTLSGPLSRGDSSTR